MAHSERQVNMLMFYIWLALIIETQVRFGCAWAFCSGIIRAWIFFYPALTAPPQKVNCRFPPQAGYFIVMGEKQDDVG